jgi:hypothetical protein
MEEKEMKVAPKATKEKKQKLSYDELNNAALQLAEQNRKLYQEVQRLNTAGIIKRLEFLFDVLKYKDVFNVDFVNRTVAEIEEALTIKPQEENEQTSSN